MHLLIQPLLLLGFGLVAAFSSSCGSAKTTKTTKTTQTPTHTSIATPAKPKATKVSAKPKANAHPTQKHSTQSTFSDAKNNQQARQEFVASVIKHQSELSSDLNLGDYRGGVSLVVLAKNKAGEMCVVLGEEKAGPYQGKLNFIGGKIDTAQGSQEEKLVGTLYDEGREELGTHLAYDTFKAGLIYIKRPNNKRFHTMLCFCYLSGIDTGKWDAMYQKRKKKDRIDWKYIEMSRIAYIPIAKLAACEDNLSTYVNENIKLIEDAAAEAIKLTPPSIKALPKVRDSVPMLLDEETEEEEEVSTNET